APSIAGTDKLPAGAESNAMAGISITNNNIWSAWNNQAGLSSINKVQLGWYTELPYGISELQNSGMALAIPTDKYGTFAVNVNYFGYSLYNESAFGLAYGKKLSENVSVGVGLNYHQISISEPKGNAGTVTAEIGLQTTFSPKLSSAFHLYNPTRSVIDTETTEEELPGIAKFALTYKASEKVHLVSEIEKDFDNDAILKFGFDYTIIEDLHIRGGIHSNDFEYGFGVGYKFSKFNVDVASKYQQDLGFTPSVSMFYTFN
ncbi:MAG: hypothetical protein KJO64_03870, partial [Bacteroidia bacterium]|nr:hypothetical protein [Bacteroidia bacterium]